MNIYTVKDSSFDEIKANSTLYNTVIDIMTYVDRKAPEGSCCGRNKDTIISKFMTNRDKYISEALKGQNRKIKPLWRGPIRFSKSKLELNANYITDEEILKYVESGQIDRKYFDWSDYNEEVDKSIASKEDIASDGLKTAETKPSIKRKNKKN